MSDYLTRRNGVWQFVRKVPLRYRGLDPRVLVRQSTLVEISKDRNGRRARQVAEGFNRELEAYWRGLAEGKSHEAQQRYDDARLRAKTLGLEYLEAAALAERPTVQILERLERLMEGGALAPEPTRAAVLGGERRPAFLLSNLFTEFESQTRAEMRDMSVNQMRIWRNGKRHALENFISVIGDKPLQEISHNDALDFSEWWQARVLEEDFAIKTANKDIGHLSRMLKVVNRRHRLGLPNIFAGMRLAGSIDRSREPFDPAFVQKEMINSGKLMELNDEARRVVFLIADTRLRISEAVNLTAETIHLDAQIPHIQVRPDGRRMKTAQSERDVPLVGAALAAMLVQPAGFPRYRDKNTTLSATVNKFLGAAGLRTDRDLTVYSLRHTFKDRLVEVEAPDSIVDHLMGHKVVKPKYGKGPPLELKLKWLHRIAFTAPSVV